MQITQDIQAENNNLRVSLEQIGNDKMIFAREKIDELVNKEVQMKMQSIGGGQMHEELQQRQEELNMQFENMVQMKSTID